MGRGNTKPSRRPPKAAKSDPVDYASLDIALRKLKAGEAISKADQRLIKNWKADEELKRRWSVYESIPQADWAKMAKRTASQLSAQAAVYGLPFGEASINLKEFCKAFHDFLGDNATIFRMIRDADGDPLMLRAPKEAQAAYAEEKRRLTAAKASIAEIELAVKRADTIPRQALREVLTAVAGYIREGGDALEKRFGREARAIMSDIVDTIEEDVKKMSEQKPGTNGRR